MDGWIEPGDRAPDFTLHSDEGAKVSLKKLRGKTVVLYFYPRDNTSGCTREACAFRDELSTISSHGAVVLGVNTDSAASHTKFREKHSLNFPLLIDADHKVAALYGAWREKNMYGKKSWGIQRSTFLIDAKGTVQNVWKRVAVDGHLNAVVKALEDLPAEKTK